MIPQSTGVPAQNTTLANDEATITKANMRLEGQPAYGQQDDSAVKRSSLSAQSLNDARHC